MENSTRDTLITEYYPLVDKILKSMKNKVPPYISYEDLHGAAVMGLLDAIKKYDESKKDQFFHYTRQKIKWFIQDELRRLDFISRKTRAKLRQKKDIISKFEQQNGRTPTSKELASELGLTDEEFENFISDTDIPVFFSLNQEAFENQGSDLMSDFILDEAEIERKNKNEQNEFLGLMSQSLSVLDVREKIVIKTLYFKEGGKLENLANELNLSEARICQLKKSGIKKIKKWFIKNQQM